MHYLFSLESFFNDILKSIDPLISKILNNALDEKLLSEKDALELFKTSKVELLMLGLVADEIRRKTVGDTVTFVINRNINFTNICSNRCSFCAFSRNQNDSDAYLLSIEEIARRSEEAWRNGATEVCIQGGLNPNIEGSFYPKMCKEIKKKTPNIHIHAFSPMEIVFGARKSHSNIREFLKMLKEAGLDSMPGTAAEILDDDIRKSICPEKIDVQTWIDVIKTAHNLGIPTTSTMMYGHIDEPRQWANHIRTIRDIQKQTNGFTEFIPLSFVHPNTELYKSGGARPGATGIEDLKVHAISRLMLNEYINNIQVSWVKLGSKMSEMCLMAGANDLGGTLTEENISKTAGATTGQRMERSEMEKLIRKIGRVPAQRDTIYNILNFQKN
jgi:7,8-didemethyl-8-hydroxy-5-deazariboflavin synthase CofH subunit